METKTTEKRLSENLVGANIVASRYDEQNDKIFFLIESKDGKTEEYPPTQQQLYSFITFLVMGSKEEELRPH